MGSIWQGMDMGAFDMAYRRRFPTRTIKSSNKYGNKKVEYDGIKFDSKKECTRYAELKLEEKAGRISDLQRQVKFVLIPALREEPTEQYTKGTKKGQFKPGKVIERECAYIADFVYSEGEKTVVEDTKGMKTKDYIIKRKLMLWVHGIRIREV